jgi:hypothetical protein
MLRFFRAPSPRDAIDGRDKNERGEGFNLSRQTGKERPCARYWRAPSRQFASHRSRHGRRSFASTSWNACRPSPAEALVTSAPMSGSPRVPPSPSIRPTIATPLSPIPRRRRAAPDGRVEATADVVILRPADPTHGNGTLLLEVPNRGRKLAPQLFDDSSQPGANNAQSADDAGIGFLHRQGYTMVWVGWQGDIPSRPGQMALTAPVLKRRDRACARGIRLRHHDKSRAGNTDLARGRSRQPHHHRSRRLGRRAPDAIRPLGPPCRSLNRRDHAARRFRCRRALRDHLHGARSGAARHGALPRCAMSQASCAAMRRRPIRCCNGLHPSSAARSASAFRNPAASCATSSISASTRICRAASCSTA